MGRNHLDAKRPESRSRGVEDPLARPEVRWGLGCFLGAIAMTGSVILVGIIVFALNPPGWVQVVLGIGLILIGAAIAWLVATALAKSRAN